MKQTMAVIMVCTKELEALSSSRGGQYVPGAIDGLVLDGYDGLFRPSVHGVV